MTNCIFCKIIKDEIPSAKIYEDDKVFSFLDIAPNNKGHALVVPKKHSENFLGMDDDEKMAVFAATGKISGAISKALDCDFNIVMNNGKNAGQVVFHSHVHIIPRFQEDGIRFQVVHKKYEGNEMKEFAEKIRECIDG